MEKIALFIAGDERIYFPALVTILSIKNHNRRKFDYFLCFDEQNLTHSMSEELMGYEIHFIHNKTFQEYEIEQTFRSMSEGRWPVKIFYNYVLPIYLEKLGYKYSIKADYDLLCIGEYDLESIMPIDKTIGGLTTKVNLFNEGVTQKTFDTLKSEGKLSSNWTDYMNVGFITFNNKNFTKNKCFEYFVDIYKYLAQTNPEAKLLEQIAFSILLQKLKDQYINFSDAYNHRVLWTRATDQNLNFDTKNIHYITQFKPWKPFELDKLKWFLYRNLGSLFAYRNLWLEFAETIPSFEQFCTERRLNEHQLAALQMFIVRNYNDRINKLEQEIKDEKKKYSELKTAIESLPI